MKANLCKMTAILAVGVFFVAPAMAFDVCGNGYCCTTCIPDERQYCPQDCQGQVCLDSTSTLLETPAPAENVAEATPEVFATEMAPLAN
jgi:hypothetical protein